VLWPKHRIRTIAGRALSYDVRIKATFEPNSRTAFRADHAKVLAAVLSCRKRSRLQAAPQRNFTVFPFQSLAQARRGNLSRQM